MESRTPPNNIDAEQSVLGSILLDNEVYANLEGMLAAGHFYKEGHRKIFRAFERLFRSSEPMDLVTLTEELRQANDLDSVGGVPYLIGLADSVPTAAYAESYARIVLEKATLRELISTTGRIMQAAYDQAAPLEEILDQAEHGVFELATKKRRSNFEGMGTLVGDTFAQINEMFANPDPVSGLRTGFKELDITTAGLQPSSLNVLAARPSMGKCVTATTRVVIPETGERITVEEFVRRRHPCVASLGAAGRVRPSRVTAWIDSGVKPAFRVTTRTGRSVETTAHHPFLAMNGWTPLHDLKIGDPIAVPRALPIFGVLRDVPLELARLLGHLLADGNLTNPSPRFTNTDPQIVADVRDTLAAYFPGVTMQQRGIDYRLSRKYVPGQRKNLPNPVTTWLRGLGVMGLHAEDKHLPAAVWTWDRPRLRALLRALFSCDATIYALSGASRPRIEFTVASQRLAEDVHHALNRFGIVSKLWRKTERSWRVEITEPESADTYQREIGWIGEKSRRVFAARPSWHSNVGHLPVGIWRRVKERAGARGLSLRQLAIRSGEHVVDGFDAHTARGITQRRLAAYAEVLDDDHLRLLSGPDVYWDEIVAIEPLGPTQLYDLTVPDGANFVADDVFVHNTAFALTIALNAALRENVTVGIFSLEMSAVQLVTRMLCSEARVDMTRVRNGQLSDRDFQRLADTAGRMSETRIFIDDHADMTVMELRARARRLMAEHDLGLLVIDYLQLMSGSRNSYQGENRQQEISAISRGLKALARELDVPILVLSQLSRAVESRPNKRPMLSDLRECVPGDTRVVLADGRRTPIRDLVGTTPSVLAVAANGRLVRAKADKVWSVGHRDVLELRLSSGRTLRATGRHRVLTGRGWCRMADLTAEHRVAVAPQLPAAGPLPAAAAGSARDGGWEGGSRAASAASAASRAAILDDPVTDSWADPDLHWDTVVEVVPLGAEEVFDLTVPGPANWLADGIVSHNSGAIEQDADLVMFIYRDEYYDPQTEKHGIAEIIIGKQRNGPTGTSELQFHNSHVRFNDLAKGTP